MLRKKQVITMVSVAVVSFLIGTTFSVMTMATDGGNPFDAIWEAIYGLQSGMEWTYVKIETLEENVQSLSNSVVELHSEVNTLEGRVEELESQMLPQGFVREPAFDSGWIFSDGHVITLHHNLGTENLLVYLIGRHSLGEPITGNYFSGGQSQMGWGKLNATHINISGRYGCVYVRVRIWMIQ